MPFRRGTVKQSHDYMFGILENYHCCRVVDFTVLGWCRVSKLLVKFCWMHLGHVLRLWMCFRFFRFCSKIPNCDRVHGVCFRTMIHHHQKRCLSSCTDIRFQKASYIFSHMHFSYWLVFLCRMSIFRHSVPQEVRWGFLLPEWAVTVTGELGTGRLVYTVSLSHRPWRISGLRRTRLSQSDCDSAQQWKHDRFKLLSTGRWSCQPGSGMIYNSDMLIGTGLNPGCWWFGAYLVLAGLVL